MWGLIRWRRAIAKVKVMNRLERRTQLIRAENEFRDMVAMMLVYTRAVRPTWKRIVQERMAVKIQASIRGRLVYKNYQEMHVQRRKKELENKTATKIQVCVFDFFLFLCHACSSCGLSPPCAEPVPHSLGHETAP